jgi:uncharacterized membrane protein HdeD (DUF308 family)
VCMLKGPQNRNRRLRLYGILEILVGISLIIADVFERNWYWIVVSAFVLVAGTCFLISATKTSRME